MPDQTIYTLDREALLKHYPVLAAPFPLSSVTMEKAPYFDTFWRTDIRSTATGALACAIPCHYLTPDPTPTFRLIVTEGAQRDEMTFQGFWYPDDERLLTLAPLMESVVITPGFTWVGLQIGTLRLSIERL